MRKQILHKVSLLLLSLFCLGLIAFLPKHAQAANPATINFQGKIVNSNGTNIADGTYSVVFRIYNVSNPTMTTSCTSTASCLWEETQGSVSVANGVFQIELGSACSLTSASCNNAAGGPINYSSTSSLYLTMQFNGDTSGSRGGFMFPLIHMNSVPFALYSDNSGQLGGLTASNFVKLAQGVQADTSTSNPSIFINKNNASGTPNIIQLQKASADVFIINNSGLTTFTPQTASATAFLIQNTSSNKILAVDTSTSTAHFKIYDSSATQGYADIYFDDATSSAVYAASGSNTTKIGTGTGSIGVLAGASSAITITGNATSTYTTTAGFIRLDGPSGIEFGTASSSNGLISFINLTNSNLVGITVPSGASAPSAYNLVLPSSAASNSCLQSGTVSGGNVPLSFGSCGSGSGVTGTAYSTSNNANGSSVSGSTLTIYKADGSNPGLLSADDQTIGGNKTFSSGSIIQTPTNPVYINGMDSTTGAGSDATKNVFIYGNYEYIAKVANGGTCSSAVSTGCELQIYDISNPSSPAYVGGADSLNSGAGSADSFLSVYVAGRYAYVGKTVDVGSCTNSTSSPTRDGCEFLIFDVTNPASPTYIGGFDAVSGVSSIYVSGQYASVTQDGVGANSFMRLLNISNPYVPTSIYNIGSSSTVFTSAYIQGKYMYVTETGHNGAACSTISVITCELIIYDISTVPPTLVGVVDSFNAGNGANSFNKVFVSGRYAYVAAAGNSGTCSSGTRDGCELQIYDISNPASPVYKGGVDSASGAGTDSYNTLIVSGKYAYVGKVGNSGTCSSSVTTGCELLTYDISNPSSPSYKGGVDNGGTTDANNSVFVNGRYAYIGKVGNGGTCSSSVATGCENQILDLSGVDAVTLTGGSIYAGVLQVGGNGQIGGDFNIQGAATVGQNIQVAGSVSTGSSVVIASSGGIGNVTLSVGSTSSNISLTLPTSLPGASNYCIVSTNLGVMSFSACGASSTATATLTPEFPGAVMTGDTTNNTGTMTSDFCSNTVGSLPALATGCNSGETHNFYQWTANATNDYEIFVKWAAPSDFSSFSSYTFNGFRSSTSDAVTVTVYSSTGGSCGSASISGTVNTWNDNTALTTSCTPNPGDILTFDIHLSVGVNNEFARMGEIAITYNRK